MLALYSQPDLYGQRIHEREEPGGLARGDLVQDGDAEVHERLGEVDHGLAGKVDRHRADRDVSLVLDQFCEHKMKKKVFLNDTTLPL